MGAEGTEVAGAPGVVVWITGLSAAGKSTLARRVAQKARPSHPNLALLDGDRIRAAVGDDLGHSPGERLANAYRLSRLAALLSEQGLHVVCATMSLFPEIWELNRRTFPRYLEVYLRARLEDLERRDPRGLYARARQGLEKGVVGVDLPLVEPAAAHLVLDQTFAPGSVDRLAAQVLARLDERVGRPS